MVVARHRQDAALGPGAGEVGVLECIPGAIDAGGLAVPHAENAVVRGGGEQVGLLAAPYRCSAEILVETFLEDDVVEGQKFAGAVGLLVKASQGRAAIAGNEAARLQSRPRVEAVLVQEDADQRLHAGDENPTTFEQIFVVECYICVPHRKIIPFGLALAVARIYKCGNSACQSLAQGRPVLGKIAAQRDE